MTIKYLTLDLFSDKIGHAFVVEEPGVPAVTFSLTEAKASRSYPNAPRESFSLMFTTKGDFIMPQRMYALRHPGLGLQSFFLVPVAKQGDTATYQAIFN